LRCHHAHSILQGLQLKHQLALSGLRFGQHSPPWLGIFKGLKTEEDGSLTLLRGRYQPRYNIVHREGKIMRKIEKVEGAPNEISFCLGATLFSGVAVWLFSPFLDILVVRHVPDILFLTPFFIWGIYWMAKNEGARKEGKLAHAVQTFCSRSPYSPLTIIIKLAPLDNKYKWHPHDSHEKTRTKYAINRNRVPSLPVGGLARRKKIKRASGTAPKKAGDDGDGGDGETPRPRSAHSPTPPLRHSLTTHSLVFAGGAHQ
jgi:hypothetical protein